MTEYIKKEDIEQKIQDGLNNLVLGHDAIEVLGMIYVMPAADVAPVRHGRWVQVIVHVEFEDGFVDRVEECCSACHEPNGRRCTYFCPNCGAKMDAQNVMMKRTKT